MKWFGCGFSVEENSSSTRAASLEYHFSKHGSEVGATNLVEYLNFANSYRDQVLYDLNRGNTSDYYIEPMKLFL